MNNKNRICQMVTSARKRNKTRHSDKVPRGRVVRQVLAILGGWLAEGLSGEVVSEIQMKQGDRHCEYLEVEFKAERRASAKAPTPEHACHG